MRVETVAMNPNQAERGAKKRKAVETEIDYPMFCDFSCTYAEFGEPDAVGACRRDIGVWCRKAKRYHAKNARCLYH